MIKEVNIKKLYKAKRSDKDFFEITKDLNKKIIYNPTSKGDSSKNLIQNTNDQTKADSERDKKISLHLKNNTDANISYKNNSSCCSNEPFLNKFMIKESSKFITNKIYSNNKVT